MGEISDQSVLGECEEWVALELVWEIVDCICEMDVSSVIDEGIGIDIFKGP